MKAYEAFPSKYLKTEHLGGQNVTVTIEGLVIESIGGNEDVEGERKPVLVLRSASRVLPSNRFVLNRINWDSISDLHGDDSDGWSGKKVILYPTKTQFGNKTVPCTRVRPANGSASAAALYGQTKPIVEAEDPSEGMGDEIPF